MRQACLACIMHHLYHSRLHHLNNASLFSCFDLSFIFLSQQDTFVSQIGLAVGGSACVEGASGFKNMFGYRRYAQPHVTTTPVHSRLRRCMFKRSGLMAPLMMMHVHFLAVRRPFPRPSAGSSLCYLVAHLRRWLESWSTCLIKQAIRLLTTTLRCIRPQARNYESSCQSAFT